MWGRILTAASKGVKATLPNIRPTSPALPLHLSTGRLARLTPSAALLTLSETTILATLSHAPPKHPAPSFLPLLVDFRSKAAAVGIIPGTWSRREQQPATQEIHTSRLIDRALRPALSVPSLTLPPTQLTVSVLSTSLAPSAPLDVLAVNAAFAVVAASALSTAVPPLAAARVALVDGELIAFPDDEQAQKAALSVFAAVNSAGRVLSVSVEAASNAVEENLVMDALRAAVETANRLIPVQEQFRDLTRDMRAADGESAFPRQMPRPATDLVSETPAEDAVAMDEAAEQSVLEHTTRAYEAAFVECRERPGKAHRAAVLTRVQQEIVDAFPHLQMDDVLRVAQSAAKRVHSALVLRDGLRMDGRRRDEVRLVRCESGMLPGDVHGSALFERGDTQVLACATIGLKSQAVRTEQYIEGGGEDKSFFVHYSFPPYSTGEYGRFGGTLNRREVGHSLLAERAIRPVLDFRQGWGAANGRILAGLGSSSEDESYPYCFRLSSEVLASDGSSSMATVCAGSLALMNAGCPIKEAVAGVAMGLITGPRFAEGDESDCAILTDILGAEDHFGEMDMKVTGTSHGVTACQLDVKSHDGVPLQIIETALAEAKTARCSILETMSTSEAGSRTSMPDHAPRVNEVPVDVALAVKTLMKDRAFRLKEIEMRSGARLTLDGRKQVICVKAPNKKSSEKAQDLIRDAMGDLEVGTKAVAMVMDVKQSFAIIEIAEGNASGILHVSKMQMNPTGGAVVASDSVDASESEMSVAGKMRFPDARRLLSKGDVVDVVVLESDRSKGVLRFGLISAPEKGSVRSLEDEIDAVLVAAKSTARV